MTTETAGKVTPFAGSPTAASRPSLVAKFAARYTIDADKLLPILKATAFKQRDGEVSNEQMAALLVVADQYGLNPFTREIFAFPDKQNGIVPVVGVDGWSRIINDHPQSDGFEFRQSEAFANELPGAKPCPAWMEVVIYRKDRAHPIVVREYLDEVYRAPFKRGDGSVVNGPWQTHTKRFLRHKTLIQGARIAYGFSGIYDEDEAERIIEGHVVDPLQIEPPKTGAEGLKEAVTKGKKKDKPAAPTVPSVLENVKICCDKALGAADHEVGMLALDDARDLVRVLEGDDKITADEMIEAAVEALNKKFPPA